MDYEGAYEITQKKKEAIITIRSLVIQWTGRSIASSKKVKLCNSKDQDQEVLAIHQIQKTGQDWHSFVEMLNWTES